jgi:hypothetical protein
LATFFPQGTAAAPVEWSCSLYKNANIVATITTTDTSTSFYAGLTGQLILHLKNSDTLTMDCGDNVSSAWIWGRAPLQVSLVRLASRTTGVITAGTQPEVPDATKMQSTRPR